MRKDITAHQNECPHAEVVCLNGCGATIMRKDTAVHQNECSHVKTDCPNGCGATIMRGDASAHHNECPHVKIDCPNCGAVGIPRERMRNHECFELRPPENNVRFIPSKLHVCQVRIDIMYIMQCSI